MFDFLRQEYAAARLRAMKGRLIERTKFSKLARSKSVSEIANNLENTEYEAVFYHGLERDMGGIENELDKIFVKLIEKIKGFYYGKEKEILDVFLKEWEVKNLKLLIKSVVSGEDWRDFLIPLEGLDIEDLGKSGDVEELINKLKDTEYYEPLYSGLKDIDQFGLPLFDFFLERAYSKCCVELSKGLKEREIIISYLEVRNDLINLRNISRSIAFKKDLSEFFIEPTNVRKEWFRLGSPEALTEKLKSKKFGIGDLTGLEDDTAFELAMVKNLEKMVSNFLMVSPFDTGLLLYYLIVKRNEIDKLKIITRFVKEGLDREDLKILLGLEE
jgi:V/A-type H+-transporting ATPase subunit C